MTKSIVTWHGSGMTLYQGGERLDPDEGLTRTGDAELAREYDRTVSRTSAASVGYELSRDGALVLAFGGLALTGVAAAQVAGDEHLAEKGLGDFPLLWIGVGAALLSIVPAIIAWKTHDGAVQHSLDEHLVPQQLADRTLGSVRAHNQRVMAKCGAEKLDDLPLSPSARGSVR
jgi:hypothetical protein